MSPIVFHPGHICSVLSLLIRVGGIIVQLDLVVKTWLRVRCWLAATFCWMCVWRPSIYCQHHENVLPLLEVSPCLLPRCCADPLSLGAAEGLGHKSAWFSLPPVLLLPEGVCPSMSIQGCSSRYSVLLSPFLWLQYWQVSAIWRSQTCCPQQSV